MLDNCVTKSQSRGFVRSSREIFNIHVERVYLRFPSTWSPRIPVEQKFDILIMFRKCEEVRKEIFLEKQREKRAKMEGKSLNSFVEDRESWEVSC